MDDPQHDYESVQWEHTRSDNEDETDDQQNTLPQRPKANVKERRQDSHNGTQQDHNADRVDLAGIGNEGFLICTVDKAQKEAEGTKEVYVSYLITTHVCLTTCLLLSLPCLY